ncbi:hypothetical protein [Rhizobium sp. OAE497]|uniref:hypothetical protein n=1 Tax=Rhizobium sp. OAE497 TaxID=2663796 RepID=UPI0018F31DE0
MNHSAVAAAVALNATNAIIHSLVVRGVLTGKQGSQLLSDIAKATRADDLGQAGEDVAAWLDKAAAPLAA